MLHETIAAFIADMEAHQNASFNTCGAYATDLRQLALYIQPLGIASWDEVASEHLVAFLLKLKEQQYATTSIARKLAAMKAFFHWCTAHGHHTHNPTAALSAPRVDRDAPLVPDAAQVMGLVHVIADDTPAGLRDRAMLTMLFATGMRVTELTSLDLVDIDMESCTIQCGREGTGSGRRRILPLSSEALSAVQHYLQHGRALLHPRAGEEAIFINHHGTRLTRQGFWLILKQHARLAGLDALTPHSLRHAFAFNLLHHGVELRTVKAMLGHASISTTMMYRGATQPDEAPTPEPVKV